MVSKVHTSYLANCPNGWRSTNGVERVGPSQAAPSHWLLECTIMVETRTNNERERERELKKIYFTSHWSLLPLFSQCVSFECHDLL